MSLTVENFRKKPGSLTNLKYDDAPVCYLRSEPNICRVLRDGVSREGSEIIDPLFHTSKIGEVMRATVVLPADWFGETSEIRMKKVFLKGGWNQTQPDARNAIHPGAKNAVVDVDGILYLAKTDEDQEDKFIIQRPVISYTDEEIIKSLLDKKLPKFFEE